MEMHDLSNEKISICIKRKVVGLAKNKNLK